YLLYSYRPYPYRHSFPTRRSSDLCGRLWQTESICQQMRFPKEYRIASRELPHSAILNSIKLKRCGCLYGISRASYAVPNMKNHRSEEHTSELQSRFDLVCRLLLEK